MALGCHVRNLQVHALGRLPFPSLDAMTRFEVLERVEELERVRMK